VGIAFAQSVTGFSASACEEDLRPLFTGEVKIKVPKWADAATGEWNLPRHELDETSVNEQVATLNLTDTAPGRAASPRSRLIHVDANPDITDLDAGTAGPRRFEGDEQP
jgi:hypothetical protein